MLPHTIIPLSAIFDEHRSLVGERAFLLAQLNGSGLVIQDGFVIPHTVLTSYLYDNQIISDLTRIDSLYQDQSNTVLRQVTHGQLSLADFLDFAEIFEAYELSDSFVTLSNSYAATIEMQPYSIIGFVTKVEDLLLLVKDLWLHQLQSIADDQDFTTFATSILVQKTFDATMSGWLLKGSSEIARVEAVPGLLYDPGLQDVVPHTYELDLDLSHIISHEVGEYQRLYALGDQQVIEYTPSDSELEAELPTSLPFELAKLAHIVEHRYPLTQFEVLWNWNGQELVVQELYIAADSVSVQLEKPTNDNRQAMLGKIASPGKVTGKLVFEHSLEHLGEMSSRNYILAVQDANKVDFDLYGRVAGLLIEEDSLFSPAAIVARELALPCLVRVDLEKLKALEGLRVVVDALEGEMYVTSPAISRQKPLQSKQPLSKLTITTKLYAQAQSWEQSLALHHKHIDGVILWADGLLHEHRVRQFPGTDVTLPLTWIQSLKEVLSTYDDRPVFYALANREDGNSYPLFDAHTELSTLTAVHQQFNRGNLSLITRGVRSAEECLEQIILISRQHLSHIPIYARLLSPILALDPDEVLNQDVEGIVVDVLHLSNQLDDVNRIELTWISKPLENILLELAKKASVKAKRLLLLWPKGCEVPTTLITKTDQLTISFVATAPDVDRVRITIHGLEATAETTDY